MHIMSSTQTPQVNYQDGTVFTHRQRQQHLSGLGFGWKNHNITALYLGDAKAASVGSCAYRDSTPQGDNIIALQTTTGRNGSFPKRSFCRVQRLCTSLIKQLLQRNMTDSASEVMLHLHKVLLGLPDPE